MPAYDVVVLGHVLAGAESGKLTQMLKTCTSRLWDRGAVIKEIRSWGHRDLAYRIRQRGVNHYKAHYLTVDMFCSPTALHEFEDTLRKHELVLRWMALKNRDPWKPYKEERGERIRTQLASEGEDGEAALEAAKYEYRNLVMQRIFEGKTKQEIRSLRASGVRFGSADWAEGDAPPLPSADGAGGGEGGGEGGGAGGAPPP